MPILNLFGLIFEWHDDKFELVHKNRGITLEEVASVFFDDRDGVTRIITAFFPTKHQEKEYANARY